ncbi:hypothetical protein H5410_062182 [Solanum commersonii]|uniref:SHSP domain-containing protein n=1 Tax=Solanum commersonii TaxID=4109 RepID=A0A9J5WBH5_SOLCO|nr:hypothetical protein H5410_062182 [Solanum commersonii]
MKYACIPSLLINKVYLRKFLEEVWHLSYNVQKQRWCSELVRRFSTESEKQQVAAVAGNEKSENQQVTVSDSGKKSKLFPRRRRRETLPTRLLGNALLQATKYKEDDKNYKIRYDVPGLGKEDVKIMVEKEEEGSDDEFWSSRSYGYYNNSIVLPEDAKVDEIKAEMTKGF